LTPKNEKRHLNLQELLVKMENLLRSLLRSREGEVTRKGRLKNVGGIKGVNIDYSLSLKSLTDNNSSVKDFKKIKNEEK